ncbi:MAG: MarR family transcriptional regulator [Bacteroidetes bacterium]|nr:MAG: MarR family transcriptional regulator [Bacteroidota bacterium]REK00631.1 MAG: MarR family transcriptional regulator [Bacteroidota bacterium]REK35247.1 MAG: MarR family transcriptional regulator [Bacteroidota bacterium]REK48324.1 MAG: MarR family transcriptional regulator [Bacteroidota bacterium]
MKLEDEIVQKKFINESHKLGINIIYTFNWLNAFQSQLLKKYKITPQQYNVMRILRGQSPSPCNIKLVKERMLDKMSDASRIVEKLRAKGFIMRSVNASDRRACDVIITDRGLELLSEIEKEDVTFRKLFSALSESEMKELNHLLDKLRG